MSASRILILVAVLVVVLFAVSLALSRRGGQPVNPTNSWVSRLNQSLAGSQALDLHQDVAPTNGWQPGSWTIPRGVPQASLEIRPSKRTIRKAKLSLTGADKFKVQFTPRPDAQDPSKPADPQAVPLEIKEFKPGQRPLELIFMEHGGYLHVRRLNNTGPAVFKLE